jgi:hypothetical protein
MKIKKLEPTQVSSNTLEFKVYRKVLKPSLKKMIAEHNSKEKLTQFLVKTNYEFSDLKGKKIGLIIPGDHTSNWLKLAKEEIKDDKKNTCIGNCYVKKNDNGTYVLVLLPEKGAAKKNLMIKQLEKFALKGIPFSIELGAGGELEEDKASDVIIEDVALPADEPEEDLDAEDNAPQKATEEQLKYKDAMNERLAKMDEQLSKLKEQLKM